MLVFPMRTGVRWDERREGSCESRTPRSSVQNTTSANNGYIAWAERLLLANDGNFFRGYVYRRLMTGFFVAKNADFLLLVALLMTVNFSRNRRNDEIRRRDIAIMIAGEGCRRRLSHARLERLHDWFKTWEFNGDSRLAQGNTADLRTHQFGGNFVNRQNDSRHE